MLGLPMAQSCYSIAEITAHIKERFEEDPLLQDVWVEGEVSNWNRSRTGHCYFTLKDAQASIRAVIWRSLAARLPFVPQDGQAVLAHGRVSVYEPQGQYQLYVDLVQPVGRGALYLEFEALKERLAAEGLFDEQRKRSLPPFPTCIGVVTSPTGAALRDILNVLGRRWPVAEVLIAPTLVQGETAPPQIVAALHALYAAKEAVDLILVARGGGSIEDLWAFNDERVARAIAKSPVPVISGVGHETDFTIADFVADCRAPTPSAAAEIAVPDRAEMWGQVSGMAAMLSQTVRQHLADQGQELDIRRQLLNRLSPRVRIERDRQRVDERLARVGRVWQHRLDLLQERVSGLERRLRGLNPYAILQRGYAVVRHADGALIRSVKQVSRGDFIWVRVSDGEFTTRKE